MVYCLDEESAKAAKTISDTMLAIFQRSDIYESFTYLLQELLTRKIRVEVLHASYMDFKTGDLLPLLEITKQGKAVLLEKRRLDFQLVPPQMMENPEEPFLHIIHDVSMETRGDEMLIRRYRNIRSVVSVRLAMQEGIAFICSLFAEAPYAFGEQDAHLLQTVLSPFSGVLAYMLPNSSLPTPLPDIEEDLPLLTQGSIMSQVWRQVQKVAETDSTVLIVGETGTGKELVARALHRQSLRSHFPLVIVNSGAIAESLMDSEFFGHERGSFTGAITNHEGFFEQANGGTLFLDEVGELSASAQVRLLRVLERKEIVRVGGLRPIKVDVRIIAATHRNLPAMAMAGTFRQDLLFRLNAFPVRVPSLRERHLDIVPLTHFFINKYARKMGLTLKQGPSADELLKLSMYDWPGNVRELEHVVEHALISARTGQTCGKIQFTLNPLSGPTVHDNALMFDAPYSVGSRENAQTTEQNICHPPAANMANLARPTSYEGHARLSGLVGHEKLLSQQAETFVLDVSNWPSLDELMRRYLTLALEKCQGRIEGPKGAATLLNMHPNTFRGKLMRLGVEFKRKSAPA